jgi:hypothetical protein
MKKLNFYPSLFILFFLFLSADAQTKIDTAKFALGIRGGISIPNLTGGGSSSQNPLNTGYGSRSGPDLGIYAEFKFTSLFSLQPMLEYSAQGGKKDGLQAFPTPAALAAFFQQSGQTPPTYLYDKANSAAKINYLMLPILAKFGWDFSKKVRFYVDGGPFFAYLLYAHQVVTNSGGFYLNSDGTEPLSAFSPQAPSNINSDTDIKDQLQKFNIGFEGNVGFIYRLLNNNKETGYFFIEGGGDYGFLNIQKGTANGKNNIGAGTVDIGYSFWLGK